MDRVNAMLPMSEGAADHINATVPARCGDAIDVPLIDPYHGPQRTSSTYPRLQTGWTSRTQADVM